ncbi:MAG: hypothetical protein KatS3mg008_0333 [Acidimicrobiales bacterium]|nr:MAG: hypothetical protein KatS3mg008_0333 [Acidimicrobiales bacterium]
MNRRRPRRLLRPTRRGERVSLRRAFRFALAGMVALGVSTVAVTPPARGTDVGGKTGSAEGTVKGPVRRVLMISVPTMEWADVQRYDIPALRGLLDRSAVAALSVRAVSRKTSAVDGYVTIGAGTRAAGSASGALAFEVGDVFEGQPASEEFARRTGVEPRPGELFNMGIVSLIAANEELHFDAEVGALGKVLRRHGVRRAVIANADHDEDAFTVEWDRSATLALVDDRGIVDAGRLDGLLRHDPAAPFATRLDVGEVVDAFAEVWDGGEEDERKVVLVEASDLARLDEFKNLALPPQRARLEAQAFERTDHLVEQLLQKVDARRDAVVVVAPYHSTGTVHLTVFGIRAPGLEPGLLTSGTTRRSGFLQITDVAPAILELLGISPPVTMEGTAVEVTSTDMTPRERVDLLVRWNEAALFRDAQVGVAARAVVFGNAMLWVLALLVLARGSDRGRRAASVAALGVPGFLAATYVAGLVHFAAVGASAYWVFLVVFAAAWAAACHLAGRRRVTGPAMLALGGLWLLLVVDVVTGARLQLNTVFGYTPTVAGRFAGVGNPTFAQIAVCAILIASLVRDWAKGGVGLAVAAGVLAVTAVVDGVPWFGADVGGVLSFVPAAAVTLIQLSGRKVDWRYVLGGMVAAVLLISVLGLVDAARSPEERTHLGRLVVEVGEAGWAPFETVLLRKLQANLSVLTRTVWTLMVPLVFGFAGWVFWRAPYRLRRVGEKVETWRSALVGVAVAAVLGFALNDSGIAVPGMMIGVVNAILVNLMLRTDGPDGGEILRGGDGRQIRTSGVDGG